MSAAGKRWQVVEMQNICYVCDGVGRFLFMAPKELAASVVADHNARLDAEPFGQYVERTDGTVEFQKTGDAFSPSAFGGISWRLYTHPPDATAEHAILRANLATVTAERDEARRLESLDTNDVIKLWKARATAAEAALATAKRDAWIAGRDAAASLLETVAGEDPKSEGSPFLDIAAQGIRALIPPGGRQDD